MAPNITSTPFNIETLATDFVPDGLAADTLRGLIYNQVEGLKGLDDDIRQLQARLVVLNAKRVEVASARDIHRVFLAPMRKLAPELLGEVFIQCVRAGRSASRAHDIRLSLLQVCQRWKRIAIGTPGMWTTIPTIHRDRACMSRCLDLSGRLPIKIEMVNNFMGSGPTWPKLLDNFHR